MAKSKKDKETYLKKYAELFGAKAQAAAACNISRFTVWDWEKNDPEFKKAMDAIDESFIEYVESKVKQKIDQGDDTWIWRWLKCHAPDKYKDEPKFQMQQNQLSMTGGLRLEIVRKTLVPENKDDAVHISGGAAAELLDASDGIITTTTP